jgi:hypothetical protein
LQQIRHVVLNKSLTSNILISRKEQTSQASSVKELVISFRVSERLDRDDVQREFYKSQLDHDSDKRLIAKNARDKKDLRELKAMLLLQTATFE